MDEVRLYNRALTPQEISLQYSSNLAKTNTGNRLLSFWPDFRTTLKQPVFGYSQDSAGNTAWSKGKTLIRDTTPPQITLTSPSSGQWVTSSFAVQFDIDEANFANNFSYTLSGHTTTLFDSTTHLLVNFDRLADLPVDDSFSLTNIAPRRNTYILENQAAPLSAWIQSGIVLRSINVYFAPEMGHQ